MDVKGDRKASTLSTVQGAVARMMGRWDADTRRQQSRAADAAQPAAQPAMQRAVARPDDARKVESKKGAPVIQTRRARRTRRNRRARRDTRQAQNAARNTTKARTSRSARPEPGGKQKDSRDRALPAAGSSEGTAATGATATDLQSNAHRPANANPSEWLEGERRQSSEAAGREALPPADSERPEAAAIEDRMAGDDDVPAPRIPRRTRTLADVVQPGRMAARPEAQAEAPATRSEALAQPEMSAAAGGAPDSALAVAVGDAAVVLDPPASGHDADDVADANTQALPVVRGRGKPSQETHPIPSVNPGPVPSVSSAVAASLHDGPAALPPPATGRAPIALRLPHAPRWGDAHLVFRVAVGQGAAGLALALGASALLVVERPLGMWTLGLAAVAVSGAGAGYALLVQGAPDGGRPADARRFYVRAGALVLVVTQLGTLAWGLVVLGPRLALILLLPPAIWLALRMGGRRAALVCGAGGAVVYAGFWVAAAWGAYVPLLDLDATGQALVDASSAALGLGLTLAAVTGAASWREHSDAAARARLYELRLARAEIARQRDQEEVGAELLAQALALALRGRGIDPITLDGPLSLVTEGVEAVAERLRTLQKDREDRLRLEGAVRALTRALERAWLGAPWAWPEASGTMLDELIALLRTQRLPEHGALQAARRGETPSFANQPNVGAPSWSSWSSWPTPVLHDTSAPHPGTPFGAGRRDPLQH